MDNLPVDETATDLTPADLTPADLTPEGWLRRLERVTDDHDLDALVDCFAADYVNETPAHPARSFVGAPQVRTNWPQIFLAVPDLRAAVLRSAVLRSAVDGDTVFSEWEMSGTRPDGSSHLMRGGVVHHRLLQSLRLDYNVVGSVLDRCRTSRMVVGGPDPRRQS